MYDRGLYPYTKRYLPHFNNHFSTIGVNGINEMLKNFFTNETIDLSNEKRYRVYYGVIRFYES